MVQHIAEYKSTGLGCQSCSWSAEQRKRIFPCPRSRLRIWSRETGSVVPSRVSLPISILRLNLVLTYGIPPDFRGGGVHIMPKRVFFHDLSPIYIYVLFNLTSSRWTSSLPSGLWTLRIFPCLPGSRLTIFYRDASSAILQLFNQWLNFTYSRSYAFRYTKSYFGKNRTYDFQTTSGCAGYLLDHSGDEQYEDKKIVNGNSHLATSRIRFAPVHQTQTNSDEKGI